MIKITLCFPNPMRTSQPSFVQAEAAFVGAASATRPVAATGNQQHSAATHRGARTPLPRSSSLPWLFVRTRGCFSCPPGLIQVTLLLLLESLLTWQLPAVVQLPREHRPDPEMFSGIFKHCSSRLAYLASSL